jgi:hypothetical protein
MRPLHVLPRAISKDNQVSWIEGAGLVKQNCSVYILQPVFVWYEKEFKRIPSLTFL